jgi:hypothetical protein
MDRRQFLASSAVVAVTSLAGCSGEDDSNTSNGGDANNNGESGSEPTTEEQQSVTHEMGESFTVGEGAQSIRYTVNEYSTIEDYIGSGPDLGSTPDGIFIVVNLDMENVGDESLDITTNHLKLIDQEDRTFEADTEASIYAEQDSRISAEPISFDQLQPGLSVTRAVVFDVPSGTYRFAAEPAGIFSNADTHYVPLGDV